MIHPTDYQYHAVDAIRELKAENDELNRRLQRLERLLGVPVNE